MMTENVNPKDILEWYIWAGVEETCGDIPFDIGKNEPKHETVKQNASILRPAINDLAHNVSGACKSALDVCENVSTLEELKAVVEQFEGCALKHTASKTVFGDGNPQAKLLLIGEAPGADEDREGVPFVGRSGQLLDKMMAAIGYSRQQYYICNVLPWRPPGNRTPLDSEVAVCLPFLKKQIDLVDPDFIFILGGSAANSLLDVAETISKMRGHWFEYQKTNGKKAKVLASFHPAYLLRSAGQKAKAWNDILRLKKAINDENSAEHY